MTGPNLIINQPYWVFSGSYDIYNPNLTSSCTRTHVVLPHDVRPPPVVHNRHRVVLGAASAPLPGIFTVPMTCLISLVHIFSMTISDEQAMHIIKNRHLTPKQLAEKVKCSTSSVQRVMKRMKERAKELGWNEPRGVGKPPPIWAFVTDKEYNHLKAFNHQRLLDVHPDDTHAVKVNPLAEQQSAQSFVNAIHSIATASQTSDNEPVNCDKRKGSAVTRYLSKRFKNDPSYALHQKTQARLRTLLDQIGSSSTTPNGVLSRFDNTFGCDGHTLKSHFEKRFSQGMNWTNRGGKNCGHSIGLDSTNMGWQIDHIKPVSSFGDLTKPGILARAYHYTNLQPLWAIDNLAKNNKIDRTANTVHTSHIPPESKKDSPPILTYPAVITKSTEQSMQQTKSRQVTEESKRLARYILKAKSIKAPSHADVCKLAKYIRWDMTYARTNKVPFDMGVYLNTDLGVMRIMYTLINSLHKRLLLTRFCKWRACLLCHALWSDTGVSSSAQISRADV